MNKIFLFLAIIGGFLFTSCQEDPILVFGTDHYLYFDKFWKDATYPGTEKADSTEVTFFFVDENESSTTADLIVVMAGRQLDHDLNFQLRVVPEMTTALPEEYTLQPQYTFRALPAQEGVNRFQDTIHIQLNKSARLDTMENGYRLVLEIVPNEEVKVGQTECARSIIRVVKDPVRPDWWTDEVDAYLLGTYSATKYKLFLEHVPGAYDMNKDMIEQRPDMARKLVLEFKKWLQQNPSVDEYGPIEVPV